MKWHAKWIKGLDGEDYGIIWFYHSPYTSDINGIYAFYQTMLANYPKMLWQIEECHCGASASGLKN